MKLSFNLATSRDAREISNLRNAVSSELISRFGPGHWGHPVSEKGVTSSISQTSKVLLAKVKNEIVGTLRLATKKPWAIDPSYFTPSKRALYLLDMAVIPSLQSMGIGRELLQAVLPIAKSWPADCIRLDAYDAKAGAGEFYRKCGYNEVGRVVYRNVGLIYFEKLI